MYRAFGWWPQSCPGGSCFPEGQSAGCSYFVLLVSFPSLFIISYFVIPNVKTLGRISAFPFCSFPLTFCFIFGSPHLFSSFPFFLSFKSIDHFGSFFFFLIISFLLYSFFPLSTYLIFLISFPCRLIFLSSFVNL